MNRQDVLIEAAELRAILDRPNLRLYDATVMFFPSESGLTAREQYLQGHIPGAAFFDQEALADPTSPYAYALLPEAELAAELGRIGIDPAAEVVFYANGVLPCATRAWWMLRYAGHDHVRVLNGGLAAWQAAGNPLEGDERTYSPAAFESRLRPHMYASKEEVEAALASGSACPVNTLPAEMYDGALIAGSERFSCMALMDKMDAFIPHDQLAARLQDAPNHERIITYCGGGFAATVNALAHLMTGKENVAVYDGSLSEWMGEGLPLTHEG